MVGPGPLPVPSLDAPPATPASNTATRPWWPIAFCWMVALVGLSAVVVYIIHAAVGLILPGQMEYGEGAALALGSWLDGQGTLYADPLVAPWRLTPYPPLYLWLCTVLSGHTPSFFPGRLLSVLAAVATGGMLLYRIDERRKGGDACELEPGRFAFRFLGLSAGGWAAVALLASNTIFFDWTTLCRVDTLGLALTLAALLWGERLLGGRPGGWRWGGPAALFVAALFVKQSFLAGPLALVCVLWRKERGALTAFVAWLVGLAALVGAGLEVWSGGWFGTVMARYTLMFFSPERLWQYGGTFLAFNILELGLAVVAARRFWRARPLWVIYTAVSGLGIFGMGRHGGYYNYCLELLVGEALLVGWLVNAYLSSLVDVFGKHVPPFPKVSVCELAAGLALVVQMCVAGPTMLGTTLMTPVQAVRLEVLPLLRGAELPAVRAQAVRAEKLQELTDAALLAQREWEAGLERGGSVGAAGGSVSAAGGGWRWADRGRGRYPVLAEEMGDFVVAGYDCYVCDSSLYYGLAQMGVWDENALCRAIGEQRFAAIVFAFEDSGRFSRRVIAAIGRSYYIRGMVGNEIFVMPNHSRGIKAEIIRIR